MLETSSHSALCRSGYERSETGQFTQDMTSNCLVDYGIRTGVMRGCLKRTSSLKFPTSVSRQVSKGIDKDSSRKQGSYIQGREGARYTDRGVTTSPNLPRAS